MTHEDAEVIKSAIEDTIDWWEYDGTTSKGEEVIERLAKCIQPLKYELRQVESN